MNYYNDYNSFKKDNSELLNYLFNNNSDIIVRFKHVFIVLDYLHAKYVNNNTDTVEERDIFQAGYAYVFDRINTVDLIATKTFSNDFEELDEFSKAVNLLLYTLDFQDEVKSIDPNNVNEYQQLVDFEEKVLGLIESKTEIEDGYFAVLDDLTINIFDKLDKEYYGLNEIFYDIALELKIIDEEDEIDYYD